MGLDRAFPMAKNKCACAGRGAERSARAVCAVSARTTSRETQSRTAESCRVRTTLGEE